MAKHVGTEGKVKFKNSQVLEVTGFQIEESADTAESHAMGDTWKDVEVTFRGWSATVDCHYDPSDAGQIAAAIGEVGEFSGYSEGDASGAKYLTGTVVVTGRTRDVPMDDMVSLSLALTGKGALTSQTVT